MSTELAVIQGHIRQAVAQERAAFSHKDKYEQQMKSAGYEMWTAFSLTVKDQPQYQGRQIDEKALTRIFNDRKAKLWWEKVLASVPTLKVKNKTETAARLIQWHTDPTAASARREDKKQFKQQQRATAAGVRTPSVEPTREDWKALSEELSESTMVDTRPTTALELPSEILRNDAMADLRAVLASILAFADKAPTEAVDDAVHGLQDIRNDLEEEVRQAANARFG